MVRVQFPRIPSYDEDQVALVIREGSEFSRRVPVIIGTPTIDQVVQALKESEMDAVPEDGKGFGVHMSTSMVSLLGL